MTKYTTRKPDSILLDELEPRLLFSAGLEGALLDNSLLSTDAAIVETVTDSEAAFLQNEVQLAENEIVATELVFIDQAVENFDQLIADLQGKDNIDVFILDSSQDGIDQISAVLAGYDNLDAIHLVTHGNDQGLMLGNGSLENGNLGDYSEAIAGWQSALSENADLLIYGCDLASSAEGQALLSGLQFLTDADIAASDDMTGHASLGGDWDLEYQSGTIDTAVVFSVEVQSNWQGVLPMGGSSPVIYNLAGDSLAYNEGDGAATIDQGTAVSVYDGGSWNDFSPGSLTVSFTSGTDNAEDVLSIRNQGSGAGQIGFDGSTVTYGGVAIGTINGGGGAAGTDLVITFTGNPSETAVAALFQNITYENTDTDNPTTGARTIQFVLENNESRTDTETATVTVSGVNDAPTAADTTIAATEDTTYIFNAADFNFSDVEGDTMASVKITSLEGVGALKLSGVDVTLNQVISKADIDAGNLSFVPLADGNGAGYDSFGFSVNDGSIDSVGSYTMTMDVTAVNDAPTAAINTVITNEDTTYTFTAADFNFTDVDGDSLSKIKITSLPANGTLELDGVAVSANDEISAADIVNLSFTPAANANGAAYDTFNFMVHDGTAYSVGSYAMTVDVTAVNDAPTIGYLGGDTVAYTTGAGVLVIDQGTAISLSDVDSANLDTGTYTVSITAGGDVTEDVLAINDQGAGVGNISLSGANVTYDFGAGAVTIGTWAGGSAGADLVITLNVNATPTAVQALAQNITYENTDGVSPTGTTRTVNFVLTDGDGGTSNGYDTFVTMNSGNNAPTASDNTVSATEDTAYTFAGADFNFSDVDGGDSLNQVQITTLPGNGSLTLNGNSISAGDAITIADINSGLLKFTPANNASGVAYDTFTFKVHDGTEYSAVSYTLTIDVTAVNDAPSLVNICGDTLNYTEGDGAQIIDQGTAIVLTDVDSANLDTGTLTVSLTAGSDATEDVLAINDQGAGVGNISISGSDVTYDFGAGPIIIGSFSGGSAGADLVITFNGNATPTAVQALAQNITYQNTDTDNPTSGSRTVSFVVTDGDGGTSASEDASVNVTAVNDAATTTNLAGDTLAYTEGDGAQIIEQGGDATFSDIDSANLDTGTLRVSFNAGSDAAEDVLSINNQGTGAGQIGVSGANITYAGTIIGTWSGGSGGTDLVITFNANATPTAVQALVNNTTYENTDNDNPTAGARTVRFVITDGDGGTSTNYDTTVNVSQANDAPTAVSNAVTATEDTTYIFNAADFNFADIDGDAMASVKITTLEAAGSLKLSGVDVTLNQVISKADIDAGNLTFDPTANISGTGFDSFGFSVNDGTTDSVGTYTMTIDVAGTNDAPTAGNNTVTATVDTSYALNAADFNFADIDGDAMASVKITTLEGVGALQLSGVDVTLNQVISKADIDAGNLTFVPVAGAIGTGYDSFGFSVNDGTTDSLASYTISIDVQAAASSSTSSTTASSSYESVVIPEAISTSESVTDTYSSNDAAEQQQEAVSQDEQNTETTALTNADIVLDTGKGGVPNLTLQHNVQILMPQISNNTGYQVTTAQSGFEERQLQIENNHQLMMQAASLQQNLTDLQFDLQKALQELNDGLGDSGTATESDGNIMVTTATGVSIALTAGFITWALKGSSLFAAFITTLPAWHNFDPLPVLNSADKKSANKNQDTDPDEVDSVFEDWDSEYGQK